MITLKKFYFEPNNFTQSVIEPIVFDKGINFIIGERTQKDENTGKKMNSVGKSLLVECINFCLLKDANTSRIEKIPVVVLSDEIFFCLDFELESNNSIKLITIKRNRDDSKPIIIIEDLNEKSFDKLDEAREYLEFIFFRDVKERPSLRNLLSVLIRDEKTSYDDIVKSSTGVRNYSDLIKPHLFLFNFNISVLNNLKFNYKKLDQIKDSRASIRSAFENAGIDMKEVKSYINLLQDKVEKLELAIDNLKPSEGSAQKQDEFNNLELELDKVMTELSARDCAIERIKRLPKFENINVDDLKVVYNQYKVGLGDLVKKSFEKVLEFKEQIDNFQNDLMSKKLSELQSERAAISQRRDYLDEQISRIYKANKAGEKIEGLKVALIEYKEKNDKLHSVTEKLKMLEDYDNNVKLLKKDNAKMFDELEVKLFELSNEIKSFENDLKNVHEYISGNKDCHFDIKIKENLKEYINIDCRVSLDGGSGINRVRTFIYDILLMLNKYTSRNHPGFLIHDNIFASVGRDDMVKSLNYLSEQEKAGKQYQYIVTINKDEFDSVVKEFNFDYLKKVKVELTRENQLLKTSYKEV